MIAISPIPDTSLNELVIVKKQKTRCLISSGFQITNYPDFYF
jgi:hypothetical protein